MTLKTYKIILGIFLVISVAAGGVLGYYDARLEAAINKTGDLGSVDVGDVKFDEDVVNKLLRRQWWDWSIDEIRCYLPHLVQGCWDRFP